MTVERTPLPDFPLGTAGVPFIHAGPRPEPRTVSVQTEVSTQEITLAPGTELFSVIGDVLSRVGAPGANAEVVSGDFSALSYVHPDYGSDAASPMHFSQDLQTVCPASVRHGSASLGWVASATDAPDHTLADSARLEPFGHFHLSWTDANGSVRGGHLRPGSIVGDNGLTLLVHAYSDAVLISSNDPETGLPTFAPHPVQESDLSTRIPTHPQPAAVHSERGTRRGVVSRVRPGQMIDDAVAGICEAFGFTSAEVRASLGSTVGAILRSPSGEIVAAWPAVEYTYLRGEIEKTADGFHSELRGEAVDVDGRVHSGVVAPHANPVAVTFELLVLERRSDEL